jgi:hypothetical protein
MNNILEVFRGRNENKAPEFSLSHEQNSSSFPPLT